MDAFSYLGLVILAIIAMLLILTHLRRFLPDPQARPTPVRTLDHVRLVDDPSASLGRRRDDGAGGEG